MTAAGLTAAVLNLTIPGLMLWMVLKYRQAIRAHPSSAREYLPDTELRHRTFPLITIVSLILAIFCLDRPVYTAVGTFGFAGAVGLAWLVNRWWLKELNQAIDADRQP